MNREQLQKVRDALEGVVVARHPASCIEALAILDAELAKPEPDPVAKVVLTETLGLPTMRWLDLDRQFDFKGGEYLYTAPPSREWVGLTTDEIDQKIDECRMGMADYENSPTTYCRKFANELDALLRTKNSGEQA